MKFKVTFTVILEGKDLECRGHTGALMVWLDLAIEKAKKMGIPIIHWKLDSFKRHHDN